MGWLTLISQVGNADLVRMYLQEEITILELAEEIGASNADLVNEFKKTN